MKPLLKTFNGVFGPKWPLSFSWPEIQQWCIFFIFAVNMAWLCLRGGRWGDIGSHSLAMALPFGKGVVWLIPAGGFMLLWGGTFFSCLALFITLPRRLSPAVAAGIIFFLAAICRLALLPHPPSSDIYRYLWEGRLITEGINPYLHPPTDPILAHLASADPIHAKINHPDFTAIYPPLFLYISAVVVWVNNSVYGFKLLVIFLDLATIGIIFKLLRQEDVNIRWAILYAFNPVVLYAFSGQGHLDVFQNFFLLTALYLYHRRLWLFMYVALGLAVQSKYMAVLVCPFFICRENRRYLIAMLVTIALPFLPLANGGPEAFFTSLYAFSQDFAFNDSFHWLLRMLMGNNHEATLICSIALTIALLFGWWGLHPERNRILKDDPLPGCFFILTVLLLLSPTVHFWYLSWGIVFLPLIPNAGWIMMSLTAGAYFAAVGNQFLNNGFYMTPLYQAVFWAVPSLLWIIFLKRFPSYFRNARLNDTVRSVSAVVPTLNESENIYACVAKLTQDPAVTEVIVVDGDSTDHTVEEARRAGASILIHSESPEAKGGRGGQIAKGIEAARGDVIAVVHADTLVKTGSLTKLTVFLNRRKMVVGGALGSVFDAPQWRYRFLEIANDFRAISTDISFGDQVQFFRRKPVISKNVYPNQPLMEDVELSLRLKKIGKQVYLFENCNVSARRWQRLGIGRVWQIVQLLSYYLYKRLVGKPDTAAMYRQYYKGQ